MTRCSQSSHFGRWRRRAGRTKGTSSRISQSIMGYRTISSDIFATDAEGGNEATQQFALSSKNRANRYSRNGWTREGTRARPSAGLTPLCILQYLRFVSFIIAVAFMTVGCRHCRYPFFKLWIHGDHDCWFAQKFTLAAYFARWNDRILSYVLVSARTWRLCWAQMARYFRKDSPKILDSSSPSCIQSQNMILLAGYI